MNPQPHDTTPERYRNQIEDADKVSADYARLLASSRHHQAARLIWAALQYSLRTLVWVCLAVYFFSYFIREDDSALRGLLAWMLVLVFWSATGGPAKVDRAAIKRGRATINAQRAMLNMAVSSRESAMVKLAAWEKEHGVW